MGPAAAQRDDEIDETIERLRKVWKSHPKQRLGQLISNMARGWPGPMSAHNGSGESSSRWMRMVWNLRDGDIKP